MKAHPVCALAVALALSPLCAGADWPTYQHDPARSGVTLEPLPLPLHERWRYEATLAPRPAWPAPAVRDIWNGIRELKPLVTYDRAFHTVAVGALVYFGSSADDTVRALDAETGEERWVFYTDGPVRLAPTVANGRLYAGSDDGFLYCLEAASGALRWKHRPAVSARGVPGNGRLISSMPVRTGLVVEEDRVYYFAGLFPEEGVRACAVDAMTGATLWDRPLTDVSPQGYLLASARHLVVPTGRTAPALFRKATGELETLLEGAGGAYALVADDYLYSLTGRDSQVGLVDATAGERIATFDGLHVLVQGPMAYLHTHQQLSAFHRLRHTDLSRQVNERRQRLAELRKKQKRLAAGPALTEVTQACVALEGELSQLEKAREDCFVWRVPCANPYSIVLAGTTLVTGGADEVSALDATTGRMLWTAPVAGHAYGLSVAHGRLFVSTDRGVIHCFGAAAGSAAAVVKARREAQPFPSDHAGPVYSAAAERILAQTTARDGYCLVLGAEHGHLAYGLAKRSRFKIVALESDAAKVRAAREALTGAGLYGPRVVVHQADSLEALACGPYLFNLIVSDHTLLTGALPGSPAEVLRVLRPEGGVICLGSSAQPLGGGATPAALDPWKPGAPEYSVELQSGDGGWLVIRRGRVPRSGEWCQLYANPAHTACSGDELRGPLAIQWFGEPGPRQMVDRHHRPMSSLVKAGRLFVPGNDIVFAVDAYNGTPLWQLDVPDMRRVGALKDSGQMLVTPDYLYVTRRDECWLVRVEDGQRAATLRAPRFDSAEPLDWGYLNQVDDRLYGTVQVPGAAFQVLHKDMVNTLEGDFRPMIVSRGLFCLDRHTGHERWTYRQGTLMNSAIAIGEERIYFVESRSPAALGNTTGRLGIREFCAADTFLIALDRKTGRKLYERSVQLPFEHILFLNHAENTVLLTGTYNRQDRVYYGLHAFDARSGQEQWQTNYLAMDVAGNEPAPTEGSHGEQWQHPVIIDGRIYSRPFDFDLHTGVKGTKTIYRGGHGCGGWTASRHYLYGRGGNPRYYDLGLESTHGERLTSVSRPGCWLNIIPAGGLVIIPESSSGCSCPYPIQTSLALVPRLLASP